MDLELAWNKIKNKKIINDKGCWVYTGDIDVISKYGRIQIDGERIHVHRISCAINHGLDLEDSNQFACHKCNNRTCFNPDHLYKGDNSSNQNDVVNNKCKNGHDLRIHGKRARNTNRRYCDTCHKERQKLRRLSLKAASAVNRKVW